MVTPHGGDGRPAQPSPTIGVGVLHQTARGLVGIGEAAKECGARSARSSASRHVSLMPMSENPIFLDRQTRDKYRKQRQTYQPQTIVAPHIGNLLGSLLAHHALPSNKLAQNQGLPFSEMVSSVD